MEKTRNFLQIKFTEAEQAIKVKLAKCSTAAFDSINVNIFLIENNPRVKLMPEIKKNKSISLNLECLPGLNKYLEFSQNAAEFETIKAITLFQMVLFNLMSLGIVSPMAGFM